MIITILTSLHFLVYILSLPYSLHLLVYIYVNYTHLYSLHLCILYKNTHVNLLGYRTSVVYMLVYM